MPPTLSSWRVVVQRDAGNLYLLEKRLVSLKDANPVHEAAGGTWRTFTLTVACEPGASSEEAGADAVALLASVLGDDPDAHVSSATAEDRR